MAVTVESISTVLNASSGTTPTITKPTGLAVGDLMIACFWWADNPTITRTGWTALVKNGDAGGSITSLYRVADSADVAASNFAFTSTISDRHFGVIYRISGQSTTSPISASTAELISDTSSGSFAGITPTANNVLLFFTGARTETNASAYAIANSNPSWTEGNDTSQVGNFFAGAYSAVRSSSSATGNLTCTYGTTASGPRGIIIAISPPQASFTISEVLALTETFTSIRTRLFTLLDSLAIVETVTARLGRTFQVIENLSLVETVTAIRTRLFSVLENTGLVEVMARVRGLWNAVTKNTSTWTDQSKNTSNWTNQDKS